MNTVSRIDVEDFLYHEAELLDSWQLQEWYGLFTPDSLYLVPSLSAPDMSSDESLYLIMDDNRRLSSRVNQLLGGYTWAENPFSQVRRLVTNVRVMSQEGDEIKATANFSVYRYYQENVDIYVGQYRYTLVRTETGFSIREKKAVLALDVLRPQGKLSVIL